MINPDDYILTLSNDITYPITTEYIDLLINVNKIFEKHI